VRPSSHRDGWASDRNNGLSPALSASGEGAVRRGLVPSAPVAVRLIAALLILGLAGTARADARSEARDRLEEGSALYRKGDYAAALGKFEEARALYPSPKIYFNLGQALNRLGHVAAAVDAFEKFLAEAPDAAGDRRRDAEALLNELRPRVGFVKVIAEARSEIAVDGQPVGIAPLRRTIPLDPGKPHQVTARAPGARIAHVGNVEVVAGQTVEWEGKEAPAPLADGPLPLPLSITRPPPPSLVETAPPPQPAPRRWVPWAIGGAAVAVAVVVGALVLSSSGHKPSGSLGSVDLR